MARRAVVLAVGASPRGQASVSTPTSMTLSLSLASVEFVARERDDRQPVAGCWDQILSSSVSAVGQGDENVVSGHNPEISMHGFHRV
jgi:hypothetical protein